MSTRAQIVVEENEEVKIYKHCDGYPAGVIPVLADLLPRFQKGRGFDAEYLTAHISAAFIAETIKAFPGDFTGHGLDTGWHGDIEYAYRVNKDFSISIARTSWDTEPDFRKAETVKLEDLSSFK